MPLQPSWRSYSLPRNRRMQAALYATEGQACFFTVRCTSQRSPFLESGLADIAVRCLLEQRLASRCELNVFCVMPDHVHLIVTPLRDGSSSLDFVSRFKGVCSRQMRLVGWQEKVWQPRSYDHLLRADQNLANVAIYVLDNPVRAGLVANWEDYPWAGIPQPISVDGLG